MNLSNEKFPLHSLVIMHICTYHSQARSWCISGCKLIFFSSVSLDNNIYIIEKSKKSSQFQKFKKIISYIIYNPLESMALLRVNYDSPIEKLNICYINLINSEIVKIIENSLNLMSCSASGTNEQPFSDC